MKDLNRTDTIHGVSTETQYSKARAWISHCSFKYKVKIEQGEQLSTCITSIWEYFLPVETKVCVVETRQMSNIDV